MPEAIWVKTPVGVGTVWGIDRDQVLVEFDWRYLVALRPDQVERIEEWKNPLWQAGVASKSF